jgi:hypothetical protein
MSPIVAGFNLSLASFYLIFTIFIQTEFSGTGFGCRAAAGVAYATLIWHVL